MILFKMIGREEKQIGGELGGGAYDRWKMDEAEYSIQRPEEERHKRQKGVEHLVGRFYDLVNKKQLIKSENQLESFSDKGESYIEASSEVYHLQRGLKMSTRMKIGYLALHHMPDFVPGATFYRHVSQLDTMQRASENLKNREKIEKEERSREERIKAATRRHEGILAATESRRKKQQREAAVTQKQQQEREQAKLDMLELNLRKVNSLEEKRKGGLSDEAIVRWQEHYDKREFEQLLNSNLTKVSDIVAEASREGSNITKREIDGVDMYELHGRDFRGLQHVVDYKLVGNNKDSLENNEEFVPYDTGTGAKIAARAVVDPRVYAEKERPNDDYGDYVNWRRNGLSLTYIDTKSRASGAQAWQSNGSMLVVYGYDRMPTNRIMVVSTGDAGTSNFKKYDSSIDYVSLSADINADRFSDLTDPSTDPRYQDPYNEVAIRRYDENGEPLPPNYILTTNGKVNKYMLRHARYWHIPIISLQYNRPAPKS